jgi:hypothetical protein
LEPDTLDPIASSEFSAGIAVVAGGATSPADFDASGAVDGNDFLAWQRGLGTTMGALRSDGDANGDGDVDADDLAAWRSGFSPLAPMDAVATPQAALVAAPPTHERRHGAALAAELVGVALADEAFSASKLAGATSVSARPTSAHEHPAAATFISMLERTSRDETGDEPAIVDHVFEQLAEVAM